MKLIAAQKKDWQILLEWRNDDVTRRNSLSSERVSEENHKNWLDRIIIDDKKNLYVAEQDGIPIGTVRADINDSEIIISWTVAPNSRKKGFGKKMVAMLVGTLNGKIIAIIKNKNTASIKVAEFAGLSFDYEEDDVLFYTIQK